MKYLIKLKKMFGLVGKFISVYRILFIAGGLVIAFITSQQIRIKSKQKTISNQKEKITKQQKTIKSQKTELKKITKSNETTNQSLTVCLSINAGITEDLADAENKNNVAVGEIEKQKDYYNEKIKHINQSIKPNNVCDNTVIDDNFVKLMRKN